MSNNNLQSEIMNHLNQAAQKIVKLSGGCPCNITNIDYQKANELLHNSQLAASSIKGGKKCNCKICSKKKMSTFHKK